MFSLITKHTVNSSKNIIINPAILARTRTVNLKIKWEPPERISRWKAERTGDIGSFVLPDPTNICVQYQFSSELENAEPNVRNQFTLGWHPLKYTKEFYEKTLIDSVRSHVYDYNSPVAMIAQLTGSIRYMQWCIANQKERRRTREVYRLQIHKLTVGRFHMLKNLRQTDYKQYEWLLERLDLQFKPKPSKENEIMISRKEGLRQLTNSYCEEVKNEKLDAYRKQLDADKLPFLEQKLKNLEFIRNEQMALKVPCTITKEQIEEIRKQYEEMKKVHEANKIQPTKKKWRVY
ncbi:28S ribosomal protein S15, mitochondrial [Contarinia nasturtii]|uniref:28S ribosomal protein S15, mitochondrial n=1 Tax=Contarinia nasturtii TaxID=265458 RepID=UPI0012D42604|nr:28S ribosomal protein S15, mitochondrial [Contarinia nasturtii]